jgi:hypothetical protein
VTTATPIPDLDAVQTWTREYASFSQSRSGLAHLLGATAAIVVWLANGLLGAGPLTIALTIGATLTWLVGKEIIRRRLYQPFGEAREAWQPAARRSHVRVVVIATAILLLVFTGVAGAELWRVAHGAAPNLQILAYLSFVAVTPWIAWRFLRTPHEFVVGVLLLCACAVTSAGQAYPLWGVLLLLPVTAIPMAIGGVQEHRQFRRLVAQLRARSGVWR